MWPTRRMYLSCLLRTMLALPITTAFVIKPPPNLSQSPVPAHDDIRNEVLISLNKVLDFILENYVDINIDGLFGIMFAQIHLDEILRAEYANEYENIEAIMKLKEKSDFILFSVKPTIAQSPFRMLLNESMWRRKIEFQDGKLGVEKDNNKTLFAHLDDFLAYLQTSNMSETQSDYCLLELIQYLNDETNMSRHCMISNDCNFQMLNYPKYDPAYGITHRLLYLQMVKQVRCILSATEYRDKVSSYCSYIYWEARNNEHFGFVEELDDLFLEQITLCGYEGFTEFLRSDFIDHILDIQHEKGCFSIPVKMFGTIEKRSANVIKYGCNDHTTGLAASSLSIILRYLIQQPFAAKEIEVAN